MYPLQSVFSYMVPLFGTTSGARSYRWPGTPRQPRLKTLGEVEQTDRKSAARHERTEWEMNSEVLMQYYELAVVS